MNTNEHDRRQGEATDLTASPVDIVNLYRLFLGRDPESLDAIKNNEAIDLPTLITRFATSGEFEERVVFLSQTGRAVHEGQAPDAGLGEWLSARFGIALAKLATGDDAATEQWSRLYGAFFGCAFFRRRVATSLQRRLRDIAHRMSPRPGIAGQIEQFDGRTVSGWLKSDTAGDLRLEVWVDGAFRAAFQPDIFRRDIEEEFGGEGSVGFEITLTSDIAGSQHSQIVEIRDATTGDIWLWNRHDPDPDSLDILQDMIAEIGRMRRDLARLEDAMPALVAAQSTPRYAYETYYRKHYTEGRAAECEADTDTPIGVLMDARGISAAAVEIAVWSVVNQNRRQIQLAIAVLPEQAALLTDLAERIGRCRDIDISVFECPAPPDDHVEFVASALALMSKVINTFVVTAADVCLDPNLCAWVAARMMAEPDCDLIFFDEDKRVADDAGFVDYAATHRDPVFRSDFDPDRLLAHPCIGRVVATRRRCLSTLRGQSGLEVADILALNLRETPDRVSHIPRVLFSAIVDRDDRVSERRRGIQDFMVSTGRPVRVEPLDDILGAVSDSASTIFWPIDKSARATVIIPTRDRLDLLKPCLDSLLARMTDDRVAMQIVVVDHESQEQETKAYLDALITEGTIVVMPFSGPFNWSLMNNLAARRAMEQYEALTGQDQTGSHTLVFLNNDTMAISPDWLDRLVAQCQRPEVGVVGARLVYANGSIQHAGFVSRNRPDGFLIHEGVGCRGTDAGYLDRHVVARSAVAVTGACMAVDAKVFHDLGGFDAASLPGDGSDVDMCFKAWSSGLRVIYEPGATLYHLESRSRTFQFEGERMTDADTAIRILWQRWGAAFGRDGGFNPHFDRHKQPFTCLRPVPSDL